ncbi:hypothetical protein BD769DRAFT_1390539 [Suillus cothurnatus]|nr:hypothetical protein BD769DRAFT_1390539 [Suillus cothurnatus]
MDESMIFFSPKPNLHLEIPEAEYANGGVFDGACAAGTSMSPDSGAIMTGAGDETLRFWNVFPKRPTAALLKTLKDNHEPSHVFFIYYSFHNHASHHSLAIWALGESGPLIAAACKDTHLNHMHDASQAPNRVMISDDNFHNYISNEKSKGLDGLFEPLLLRTLDLSTYAHFNVFATPLRVLYLPLCLPEQRLRITCTAVNTLEDKYKTWKGKLEEMEGGLWKAVERDHDKEELEWNVEERKMLMRMKTRKWRTQMQTMTAAHHQTIIDT